jgi:hypothetical protein
MMYIAPRKSMLGVAANLDSILPAQGLLELPRQCLQGGNATVVPPLFDPASQILGFPWSSRRGHEQCHDNAPKKETAPVGIVVVSFKLGFAPAHPSSSRSVKKEQS